jgi:hypothetical protein
MVKEKTMSRIERAANLSPDARDLLAEVLRGHAADSPLTVAAAHRDATADLAAAELNRLGLIGSTGSSYDWDRAWTVPTELALALYELVDVHGSPYFEPRDAFETVLVDRRWAQLPLPGVLG